MFKRIEERNAEGTLTVWGKEYDCGCKEFNTVLQDGSLGWGETVEKCSACFFAE